MVSENLLCESLPSPVLRQAGCAQSAPGASRSWKGQYDGYFNAGAGSVGSSVGSRGSEGSQSGGRVSLGSERRVRWKGLDT